MQPRPRTLLTVWKCTPQDTRRSLLRSDADLKTFDAREVSATPGDWKLLTVIAGEDRARRKLV